MGGNGEERRREVGGKVKGWKTCTEGGVLKETRFASSLANMCIGYRRDVVRGMGEEGGIDLPHFALAEMFYRYKPSNK